MPLTTRDPRPMLARDDIHAAIGFFPAVVGAIALQNHEDSGDAYDHASLYGGEYVCVMRRDHPLTRRTLTLDRYCAARHLLVSFSGRPHGFVDESLARLQRSRRIVLTVNQFFTAGQVVAQSDLLTVLPRHFLAATGVRAELAVRKLPFAMPPVDVDILWHRRLGDRPGQAWLRDQIQQAAQSAFARSKAGRRS
jgi:DNA-binding transcriptional LysR family regulator